jgi:putative glycosyltransferase
MHLSIVTTMYRSAPYLKEFYERACAAARPIADDFEIIFVNDGSPDESLEVAISLFEQDERVRVVDLSRNFGHHKAIMTGLSHARGDLIFLIDSDLEEEPELLNTFHAELMRNAGADVVYGVQKKRKGQAYERVTGAIYFKLYNMLSTYPIPKNLVTVRLMTKRYVSALVRHREREISISGLWVITGFEQIAVGVDKSSRKVSTYNFGRKVSSFVNGVTAFSNKPLVYIFYLGCLIVIGSSVAALSLVIRWFFFGALLVGWPSLIISVWLLGGLTIFCLGVIGIYLSKIFMESKQRPYAIVRQLYEQEKYPTQIGEPSFGGEAYEPAQHSAREFQ